MYLLHSKLSIPYTILPRRAIETTITRRIETIIPRPRYDYFLSSSNITRPRINTSFTSDGKALDLDLLFLYVSMLLLIILLIWLSSLTLWHIYWHFHTKYHHSPQRATHSRNRRLLAWREGWIEGNDTWVRPPRSREERKIERERSRVGPQNVGKWNKWLDKESSQAVRAENHAVDKINEGVRYAQSKTGQAIDRVVEGTRYATPETQRGIEKVGERTGLLSKQRDGVEETEI